MLLHIVNKSPFERDSFTSCVKHVRQGASILLIEDGVYAALSNTSVSTALNDTLTQTTVYALGPDVEARGLTGRISPQVKLVNYEGFVDLVTSHSGTHSWL